MLVQDVMTTPVVTVPRESTIREAVRTLYRNDISAAPVVDPDGRLAGIVSEMDLLRDEFPPDPRALARVVEPPPSRPPRYVDEVMSPNVHTLPENADLLDLAAIMLDTGVKSVPIVRDDLVVGIASRRDLLGVLAHSDEMIQGRIEAALADYEIDTDDWEIIVVDGFVSLRGAGDERTRRIAEVIVRSVPGVVGVEVPLHTPGGSARS